MTHIVLGYPSFDDSMRIIEAMQEAGVDLIEMQIPFSEPIADGPVILHANQRALDAGATVDLCMEFVEKAKARVDIPLLFMSYYNIIANRGEEHFISEMKSANIRGAIIPDLPPEEGSRLFASMHKDDLAPIFIYSPNTSNERMKLLSEQGRGFIYCVARKGVTGSNTEFSHDISEYLARCKASTSLPLAVGFGSCTAPAYCSWLRLAGA